MSNEQSDGFALVAELLKRSEAKVWSVAKLEWVVVSEIKLTSGKTAKCVCGKQLEAKYFVIRNSKNGIEEVIGQVCAKQFLNIDAGSVFDSIRRVAQNKELALSRHAINYAFERGFINDWERGFYFDTIRKRRLSPDQLAKRVEINLQILQRMREADDA